MTFGTDSSIYQPYYDGHYKQLHDNGGSFDIIRAGQGTAFVDDSLDEHYANNKAAGQKMGLYHWIDPEQTGQANADFFSRIIDKWDVPLIGGDLEQWWEWASWSACYEKHLIPVSSIIRLPSQKIFDCTAKYYDVLKTRYQGKKIFIYSAQWFIDGFVKGYDTWSIVKDLIKWIAFYYNNGQGDIIMTWPQFRDLMAALSLRSPLMPTGWLGDWDIWQFTSNVLVANMPRIDWNLVNPKSAVNSVLGGTVVIDPIKPPDPVVKRYCTYIPTLLCPVPEVNGTPPETVLYRVAINCSWLSVCKNPSALSEVMAYLSYKTQVDVYEISGVWGCISNGWINLGFTVRV